MKRTVRMLAALVIAALAILSPHRAGAQCALPSALSSSAVTTSATLSWTMPANVLEAELRYRKSGTSAWTVRWVDRIPAPTAPYTDTYILSGLAPGTTYEWKVRSNCSPTSASAFVTATLITAGGSATCAVPSGQSSSVSGTSATLSWAMPANVLEAELRYRATGAASWNTTWVDRIPAPTAPYTDTYILSGLTSGTSYEWQVRSNCSPTSASAFTASSTFATVGTSPTLPQFDHIVVVVEENHSYNQLIGGNAPFFASLIAGTQSALFSQFYAITHPSQPNYVAMTSGSTQGVTDDNCFTPKNVENIFHQLGVAGKTYKSYLESLPSVGYTGCSSGGSDGYWRKHNPASDYSNVDHTKEVPFTQWPSDYSTLPYFSFVVPNQANDWHNGTITQMDNWLSANMGAYAAWAKTHNSLLVITFDEDDGGSSNRIPTLFAGANVVRGTYANPLTLYSLLRMLEDMNGLSRVGAAASANPIDFCWGSTPAASPVVTSIEDAHAAATPVVYPNPNDGSFRVSIGAPVRLAVYDLLGRCEQVIDDYVGEEVHVNGTGIRIVTADGKVVSRVVVR